LEWAGVVGGVTNRIAVIEGDGIGREVIPAALEVIAALDLGFAIDRIDPGPESRLAARFLRTGEALTDDDFERIAAADAVLLGAIGDPQITDHRYTRQTLLRVRGELDLYANVRPARLRDERLSPLRGRNRRPIDLIVVRENTEGLYSDLGGQLHPGTPREVAVQQHLSTYHGVARVVHYAFTLASREVVMADKPNAMPYAGRLWGRCWAEAAAAHPQLSARRLAVDACAMHMIEHPGQFDVVVTENCFGDILSDIAGRLAGGIGMAPSANVNVETGRAMFEPVHGSAPDIAGEGVANPVAAILSGALMLRHLGFTGDAQSIENGVTRALRDRECTRDAGGGLCTTEAALAVIRRMR
jgi:3-isopropylmalate dehydrogenase